MATATIVIRLKTILHGRRYTYSHIKVTTRNFSKTLRSDAKTIEES